MTSSLLRTPVLIVGAGPAGLTASLLLQRYGIESVTVNRFGWTAHTPRAHYQNQRSLEILRELGLEEPVVAAGLPEALAANVVWTETLAGVEYARIPTYMAARVDAYRRASPCPSSNIAQTLLEPIMAKAALERGARIRWSHELLALEQDAQGVTAEVLDRAEDRRYRIRADYLIGADGARSVVADQLGIRHRGPAGWAAAVNVWFKADLARYCAHRPGILYWTNRPGANFWVGSGGFINVKPWNEWVLSFMYDPSAGQPDLAPAAMAARIRQLVGDEELAVEVLSVNPWQMNAQVAERMGTGRAFIAGDAAHRHPPSGALGSNTSMQDSYNLAWKIAAVLQGHAGPALLDSYDRERRPVAAAIVERSMANIEIFKEVAAAIGFSGEQTAAQGWESFHALARPGDDGQARRHALRRALQRQQYHFGALGFEMGVHYAEGALVPDDAAAAALPAGHDPLLDYVPDARPGAHLPHVWLRPTPTGPRRSTLDICRPGRMTLLVGHGGAAWRYAAAEVAAALQVPLDVVAIGIGLDWTDIDDDWAELSGTGDDGCLLVRPDKVVAWRRRGAAAAPLLHDVMCRVLARA